MQFIDEKEVEILMKNPNSINFLFYSQFIFRKLKNVLISSIFRPKKQLYWVAPLSGALVASVVYRYVFYREVIDAEIQECGHRLENLGEASDKV